MTIVKPRELVNVLVEVDARGVVATFDLGGLVPFEPVAESFIYGITLTGDDGAYTKQFGVRFSPTKTAAFIFHFPSATQSKYDATHIDDASTVVVRFPDSSLGTDAIGTITGFSTVNGQDVSSDVAVQLLK